jgi:hypothetical protein
MSDTTIFNNDTTKNADDMEKLIKNIPNNYEFVYFPPTPSSMAPVDLLKCYSTNDTGIMKNVGESVGGSNVLHTRDTCKFNAGMIQSQKKQRDEEILKTASKQNALSYKIIQGYFNDDVKKFINSPSSGQTEKFSDVSPNFTNGTKVSVEWFGYFTPPVSGNWTFTITSEDSSILWLGSYAVYDYINDVNKSKVFLNNTGRHKVRSVHNSSSFTKGVNYPIRIQHGNASGNYTFNLSIKDPKGNETNTTHLYTITKQDGSMYTPSLTYYALVEDSDPNSKKKGLFKCYVSDNVSRMTSIEKGCSGTISDTNGTFRYTTTNDWANYKQNYHPYRVHGDQHFNNTYLANKKKKTFNPVSNNDMSLSPNSYIKYAETYPDLSNIKSGDVVQLTKAKDMSSATQQSKDICSTDSTCKYFYVCSISAGNNKSFFYYIPKKDNNIPKQFIPKQYQGDYANIINCDLYIRDMNFNKLDKIQAKIPYVKTSDYLSGPNYKAYSDYEILPDKFNPSDKYSGFEKNFVDVLKQHSVYYENYKNMESFDNHGYIDSNTLAQRFASQTNRNIITDISNNQIAPMKEIANDYTSNVTLINNNYIDISNNLSKTNSLLSTLTNDPNNNYDHRGDTLNYDGVNGLKRASLNDAINDDIKAFILQQNTIYILGSIAAAALLILAINVGK